AARGAGAAGRAHAAHRHAHESRRRRSASVGPRCRVLAGVARAGLDGRPQPSRRAALGRGRSRAHAQARGGIGRACAGRHSGHGRRNRVATQSDPHHPVVFVAIADPVAAGFVESLARPGGNATGFTTQEYSLSVKHLELLKEIAADVTRIGVLRDANSIAGIGQFGAVQAAASSLKVELTPRGVRDKDEIEHGIAAFARKPNSGLIVTGTASTVVHRDLIIMLAARHKLRAVYPFSYFAAVGGLISYGSDTVDQYRRAA